MATGHESQTMRTNRFLRPSRVAPALLLFLCAAAAWAQYPSRPIRLLVPNPPGGATDTIARVVAPRLGEALGQPVVVENRPGSNGNLSSELAARAAPDGYTLLLGQDSQIVISPHLYANLPVDTLKDLTPVSTLVTTQMVLSSNPALPVKNLQEFLEYARRAKPPLAYASIGNGSQHHLTMEMLKTRAGIELIHVPYKGGGPATIALLAGEVPVMFGGNSVTGHIKAGKLRGLAVAGKRRSATFPDLPTLGEFFPGLEVPRGSESSRPPEYRRPCSLGCTAKSTGCSPAQTCAKKCAASAGSSLSFPRQRNSPRSSARSTPSTARS